MVPPTNIPLGLQTALQGQTPDFVIKSQRRYPARLASTYLFIGAAFLLVSIPALVTHLISLIAGDVVPADMSNALVSLLFLVVFMLLGWGVLGYGYFMLSAKGGWFAATRLALLEYRSNYLRSIDWEQFAGDIRVNGGDITLLLRTGELRRSYYVPDKVFILGSKDAHDIERILRKRIQRSESSARHNDETIFSFGMPKKK